MHPQKHRFLGVFFVFDGKRCVTGHSFDLFYLFCTGPFSYFMTSHGCLIHGVDSSNDNEFGFAYPTCQCFVVCIELYTLYNIRGYPRPSYRNNDSGAMKGNNCMVNNKPFRRHYLQGVRWRGVWLISHKATPLISQCS